MSLLYDQLVANPHIDKEIKQCLKGCIVIEASNVSDYYYQGTDQEIWHLADDFPNLAPPFETFFLEFRAPEQVISKGKEARDWQPDKQPIKWGLMCQSELMDHHLADLSTPEGRANAIQRTMSQLESIERTLNLERFKNMKSKEEMLAWVNGLSEARKKTLGLYYSGTKALRLMQAGKWDEVDGLLSQGLKGVKWIIALTLFAKFNSPRLQSNIGPLWGIEMHVNSDGRAIKQEDETVNVMHHAYGTIERYLHNKLSSNYEEAVELHEELKDGFMPMFHTALLSISFMHCKNVTLNEVKPCHHKPLTNKQKRRGELPRQYVTYHVLDIEPMKQVLKTEGQSEKVGIQRSLHICRGHFAHYGEDKKLFGKYAGTFWIPQHVRGSQDAGIALKDYRIKKIKGMPA